MTREEAAKICQSIKFILGNSDYTEEVEEALNMAIETLEQEETLQNLTKPNKSDLISRQAAIDAITNTGSMVAYHDASQSVLFGSAFRQNEIIGIINALPSAEPKTGEWISVSERLPSDGGNYLITVADLRLGYIGERTVAIADFYAKEKKWNSVVYVYAWMPLPEPYREDGEA